MPNFGVKINIIPVLLSGKHGNIIIIKAKPSGLAHAYCGTPVELGDFNAHKEHFQAVKSLRCNEQILITKPDKGSGVVNLNKSDFIKKMSSILDEKTKFSNMGCVDLHDNKAKKEQKFDEDSLAVVGRSFHSFAPVYRIDLKPYWKLFLWAKNRSPRFDCLVL